MKKLVYLKTYACNNFILIKLFAEDVKISSYYCESLRSVNIPLPLIFEVKNNILNGKDN